MSKCKACGVPMSSKLMQQTKMYCSCDDKVPIKKRNKNKANESRNSEKELDCNEDYTPSGMQPAKTAGPLGKEFDCCATYAPCGCWDTCKPKDHERMKCFETCNTCCTKGN